MPMYTARTVQGSTIAEALDPAHRPVNYSDEGAMRTVATRSRQLWLCRPEDIGFDDSSVTKANHWDTFGDAVRSIQEKSGEELAAITNPDTFTIHTPLRDLMYRMWNHVFWDVAQFLNEVNCNTGTFEGPAHEVVPIKYPDSPIEAGQMQRMAKFQLDRNIMLGAVYVQPGVKIRVLVGQAEQEVLREEAFDSDSLGPDVLFDASHETSLFNEHYVHWIRRNRSIEVFLGGGSSQPKGGLAAVLVYGKCEFQPEIIDHPCSH